MGVKDAYTVPGTAKLLNRVVLNGTV